MTDVTFSHFDAAEHLDTEEDIAAYLDECSQDGNPAAIALALGAIARARNMSQLARDAGLTRAGLYKALSPGGNPGLDTVARVAQALGFKLTLSVAAAGADAGGRVQEPAGTRQDGPHGAAEAADSMPTSQDAKDEAAVQLADRAWTG